ncbi:MAG: DUF177 domain-containing protein [Bacilli bacterium]|jgi:hypothetical protein|nr:DUF177 domain-containing protein [Bacilli bacterium]MCH4210588.1 DUF177 domain-containing protein [Bacilli bacterium]MCH4228546.1 DUF177 domain-containing protein [Bacilli bacterium]MCH4277318.1 DUF177 domain-containing protein [Bacilli bacterium]MCI2055230.1 DUF177 domain-containing protein [Bacilli bacterium]
MNKLSKASLVKGRNLSFTQDTLFDGYKMVYPLLSVKKCHYDVVALKVGDYAHAHFSIKATLQVEDSRDATPFDKKVSLDEDVDILNEEDEEGEGYIVTESEIDLDELALRIIVSSLPIRLTRNNDVKPKSGAGYRVLSEEEFEEEKKTKGNQAFDSLRDFPTK